MALDQATINARAAYRIKSGPSKMALMLALFDSKDLFTRPVIFEIDTTKMASDRPKSDSNDALFLQVRLAVSVASVMKEDGSGESWKIEGYVRPLEQTGYTDVSIYFHTRTRRGHLKFLHATIVLP